MTKKKNIKKDTKITKIYNEKCGNCFYNELGSCEKNPNKCSYNRGKNGKMDHSK